MADKILEVKELKLHFPVYDGIFLKSQVGAVRAVDGVNFDLYKGETLGLVGESGCGKSTTARSINQLHRPTSGEIIFQGKDIAKYTHKEMLPVRQNIQMVFQDPYASLNPRMTVGNIISEPMDIYAKLGIYNKSKNDIEKRVEYLMERVGLSHFYKNRFPHEFSGGQRQRIGIARALALDPDIILADEPVSALDVSIQAQILNLMKDLQDELNLTYLFIAHDLSVIEYISHRIAVMYLGRIVEIADAHDLYHNPKHPYTQALLSAAPIPDPEIEKNRERIILTGDVPSPDQERFGCYFCDRCSHKMDRCEKNIPQLKTHGDSNHQVACYLYE